MMDGQPPSRKEHEKTLPASIESENAILGTILIDNDQMQEAAESIEAADFYSPRNRRVFAAMLELYTSHKTIDPIQIGEILKKDNSLESIGGVTSITNLAHGIPVFTKLGEFIETVRQKSNLRKLIRTANEIAQAAISEFDPPEAVFADAQAKISEVCLQAETGNTEEYFPSLARVIDLEVIQGLAELKKGVTNKIQTGFPAIDHAIGGGIALSDVVLVAADTGSGKSAFTLQMAYNIAQQGIPTAFLAGEMTNKENVYRLLSQLSGMTNLNYAQKIDEKEHDHLVEWAQAIRDVPIKFEHRISDMQTLRSHVKNIVKRHGVKVLVIDYIQLFKMEKMDRRKRNERIAEASQEVKRMANELNIAVIEVAQFNREGAKSVQAGLHDLEGSGQLEKDASLVLILELSESEYADDRGCKYRDAKARIVKGRNVGHGTAHGRFYGMRVSFSFP